MSCSRAVIVEADDLVANVVVKRYNKVVVEVYKALVDINILYFYLKVVFNN
jgi:hypothetical protein